MHTLFIGMFIGALLGGVCEYLDFRAREGYRGFFSKRTVVVKSDDPRYLYGVMVGATAGYYAGTGENKSFEEIQKTYLDMIEREGTSNDKEHG